MRLEGAASVLYLDTLKVWNNCLILLKAVVGVRYGFVASGCSGCSPQRTRTPP